MNLSPKLLICIGAAMLFVAAVYATAGFEGATLAFLALLISDFLYRRVDL